MLIIYSLSSHFLALALLLLMFALRIVIWGS